MYKTILSLFTLLLLMAACSNDKTTFIENVSIPTIQEVGAHCMPDSIAKVDAPFNTQQFSHPEFANYVVNIADRGAVLEGLNTELIQQCIDEVSEQGGGKVIIPQGSWKTGRLTLKSNVNLQIEQGAQLCFSGRIIDFIPAVFTRIEGIEVMSLGACIYANGQENIAITGKGKLVGPEAGDIREKILTSDVIDNVVDTLLSVENRVFDGIQQDWIFPPMFISPINCKGVYIEGVSLENTAFWNIVPVYCDNVIIRGVTINSVGIPRGDGIDVESSKNVLIEYCTISSGDDCFTIKAGRGADGKRVNKPTENVVVRYCLAQEGHGGITCGSETAGMIRNLYVHDCVFQNTVVGVRFKTRRPRGGGGENLYYERLRMNLKATVFKWDMLGGTGSVGDLALRLPKRAVNALTPVYRNIHVKDIIVENGSHFVKIYGIPESPMTQLTIENAQVNCTNLFIANDAQDVTLRNVSIHCPDSLISVLDSKNVRFENVHFDVNGGKVVTSINGDDCDSVIFKNCKSVLK